MKKRWILRTRKGVHTWYCMSWLNKKTSLFVTKLVLAIDNWSRGSEESKYLNEILQSQEFRLQTEGFIYTLRFKHKMIIVYLVISFRGLFSSLFVHHVFPTPDETTFSHANNKKSHEISLKKRLLLYQRSCQVFGLLYVDHHLMNKMVKEIRQCVFTLI